MPVPLCDRFLGGAKTFEKFQIAEFEGHIMSYPYDII